MDSTDIKNLSEKMDKILDENKEIRETLTRIEFNNIEIKSSLFLLTMSNKVYQNLKKLRKGWKLENE